MTRARGQQVAEITKQISKEPTRLRSLQRKLLRYRRRDQESNLRIEELEDEAKKREERVDAVKVQLGKVEWKRMLLEKEILLQTATISKREQELRDLSKEGDGFTETT
jgi:hypothetical protein